MAYSPKRRSTKRRSSKRLSPALRSWNNKIMSWRRNNKHRDGSLPSLKDAMMACKGTGTSGRKSCKSKRRSSKRKSPKRKSPKRKSSKRRSGKRRSLPPALKAWNKKLDAYQADHPGVSRKQAMKACKGRASPSKKCRTSKKRRSSKRRSSRK